MNRALLPIVTVLLASSSPLRADVAGAQVELGGFLQSLYTVRVADPSCETVRACDLMLGEQHLQAQLTAYSALGDAEGLFMGRVDVVHDLVLGTSALEPLELYVDVKYRSATIRAGRQVITWGSGDLVFVNDIFAKDWESFFLGRSVEYLKPAVDSIRITMPYVDLVLMPRAALDRFPGRERFVLSASPWAELPVLRAAAPLDLDDGEVALRLHIVRSGWELNLYGAATHLTAGVLIPNDPMSPTSVELRAPRVFVAGGSVSGAVLGGVWNVEGGYKHAHEDPDGTDPFIPNSSVECFAGYARGLWQDASIAVQASLKTMLDHEAYLAHTPEGAPHESQNDWMFTARFTQQLLAQTLDLSAFMAWGATGRDAYALLQARYRYNDALSIDVGSNLFVGADAFTRFGSLVDNSNVYVSIRYGF